MAFPMLLLAAQAAGYGINLYQRHQEENFANMGAEMDRQQLSLQIEKEALVNSEETLASTERLRETLATQRAIFAARGISAGAGSSLAIAQRSIRTAGADERARRLSMGFRKHQMESQQRLLGIGRAARRQKRQTEDFMGGLNLLNFTNALSPTLTGGNSRLNGGSNLLY